MTNAFSYNDREIFPVVTTSRGRRIANFGRPVNQILDDGTVLPACKSDTVRMCELRGNNAGNSIRWMLSDTAKVNLHFLAMRRDVDIIKVSQPVLDCLEDMRERGEQLDFVQMVLAKIAH